VELIEKGRIVDDTTLQATPVFQRIVNELSSAHQVRKPIIQSIESITHHKLVTYCALVQHPAAAIGYDDVPPFSALLGPLDNYAGLDLLVNSGGGSGDVAEKLVSMCRQFVPDGKTFRLIVPNLAKSAATMLGLAADRIVMGYCSELGPIDPQVAQVLPGGLVQYIAAKSFIDAFQKIKDEVEQTGKLNQAYVPSLSNVNIAFLDFCEKATERARSYAMTWLPKHMCRGRADPADAAKAIAASLLDVSKYLSHAQIIDAEEATRIGLAIEFLPPADQLWQLIWEYYCRADLFMRTSGNIKLFESLDISMAIRAPAAQGGQIGATV
jgi:hypothetical protein